MTSSAPLAWVKSSYSSQDNANCLEWAPTATGGQVPVRDSKVPDGPVLTVRSSTWKAFVGFARSHRV
ncbi:DUF397 domain-containing protein [Streptomyces sp. NPDC015350]|uniref:DUF397 domain-containing protein n=1 Tax=Streptomyces sp. NPDC015350 TaxID=3364955 RepID=UPI0036FD494A